MTTLAAIRGIETTSELFRWRLVQVARLLGMNPDHLAAIIGFESRHTFSPSVRNTLSGAVGEIQFTDVALAAMAARGYVTTKDELAAMTAEDQLDWVFAYLEPYKGRMGNLTDAYLAVFAPAHIGQGPDHAVYVAPSKAYEQNKAMDHEGKGAITVADIARPVGYVLAESTARPRIEVPDDPPLSDGPAEDGSGGAGECGNG